MRGDMNRREFSKRLVLIVGGTLLAIVGVPLLILPGPGLALILLGVGLVGEGFGLNMRALIKRALKRAREKDEGRRWDHSAANEDG